MQVAGLDYDDEGNLWVSNANTQNVVSVRKKGRHMEVVQPGKRAGGE